MGPLAVKCLVSASLVRPIFLSPHTHRLFVSPHTHRRLTAAHSVRHSTVTSRPGGREASADDGYICMLRVVQHSARWCSRSEYEQRNDHDRPEMSCGLPVHMDADCTSHVPHLPGGTIFECVPPSDLYPRGPTYRPTPLTVTEPCQQSTPLSMRSRTKLCLAMVPSTSAAS